MSASPVYAVTNARFAPLHRLSVGPVPLTTPPVPLLKPCARHERHSRCAARAACFRQRLGGGVSLRLRFARRSSPPALHFPARRPQTEAGFKEAFGQTTVLSKGAQRSQYPASESSRNSQPFGTSPGQRDECVADCTAASGASRILRVGSLRRSRFRSSFDSVAAAGILAFRFSSREAVAVQLQKTTPRILR